MLQSQPVTSNTYTAHNLLVGEDRVIPLEIDDHYRMYGKEPWEINYSTKCPLCDSRIDEYDFCSCGASGE